MRLVAKSFRVLSVALLVTTAGLACAQDVTTWHYDNSRSGVQPLETILTSSNVKSTTFGKVFSLPVLGAVYAQPLYLSQYLMNDGQLHNVLLVVTAEDYVYAFDADGNNPAQGYLWRQSMLASGETWVTYEDVNVTDIKPNIGIIGTPVIDRAGGTIYLVAKSKTTSSPVTFHQRLHALNVADGAEKLNGPTAIQATVPGTGDGGTTISFSPLLNNQRASLLLTPTPGVGSGNSVVIAWASHGDLGVYHGWIMAYDAANIATQNAAWCTTPNGKDVHDGGKGSIWMSGAGLSSDDNGNIFAGIANGTFDASSGGVDYGDTAIEFTFTSSGLVVEDYFTPGDQSFLETSDNDMGMSGVLLLPTQTGPIANLLATSDKSGTIYLINRDKMGGYTTPDDSSVQDFSDGGYSIHSAYAFFNNTLYMAPDSGPLQAWTLDTDTDLFVTTPQSKSPTTLGTSQPSGSTPSISANGTTNAIIWAIDNAGYNNTPGVLYAFDAANLATEYYNSSQAASKRDVAFVSVKFTTPTIASGRVYVGGLNGVAVYGLLGNNAPPAATPQFSEPGGTYTTTQSVMISDTTPGEKIYYTTNGTTPTASSTLYGGAIPVNATETIEAIAVAEGYTTSAVASATYTINLPPAAQPTFSLTPGTYTSIQSVTISSTTSGAMIYCTTNGATPTTSSPQCNGAISVSSTETIQAIAAATGYSSSPVASAVYTINLPAAATPTFSVNPGTYTSIQSVTISDTTSGAAIHCTTNGTTPTTSSPVCGGAISVSSTETIQAIAIASGYSSSLLASATYTINLPPAAKPTFSLTPGPYTSAQSVTISSTTSGATIYCTTNGTTPTTSSSQCNGAISVSSTETIEAIATATGYSSSPVASATYTISPATATPKFSLAAGTYTGTKSVKITDATSGAAIYYTTNGITPTTSSTKYTKAISVSSTETIEAIAVATGHSNSAVESATYTIDLPAAAMPKFSLAGGTYFEAKSVTISDATSGVAIYYRIFGATPTSWTEYTEAISVTSTEEIEAVAVAMNRPASLVAFATYTIESPVASAPKFSLAAGTYTGTQSVTISDATSGAAIYYTTNGIAPTASSTKYAGAISVSSTETIEAIAVASGYTNSAVVSKAYTIEAESPETKVSLASVANLIGIYSDGTTFSATGGFNGKGSAYSSKLLGSSITYSGVTYAIGAANVKNVVKGTGAPVIPLTSGKYSALKFLAAGVVGNQPSVTFTVTYTDGSKTKFTKSISDWITPEHYSGESIALASSYCDIASGGRITSAYNLYQYSLPLNNAKAVKSITMPANPDVELVAITLTSSN